MDPDPSIAAGKPEGERPREKKKKKKSRPPTDTVTIEAPPAEADQKPDGEKKEKKKKKKSSHSQREQIEDPPAAGSAESKPVAPDAVPGEDPELTAQRAKLAAAKEREAKRRKEEKERKRRERKEAEERRRREEEEARERERAAAAAAAQAAAGGGDEEDEEEYGDSDFENYSEDDDFEQGEEEKVLQASGPLPARRAPAGSPEVVGAAARRKPMAAEVVRASTQELSEVQATLAAQNAAAKEAARARPPLAKPSKGQFTIIPSAPVNRPGTAASVGSESSWTSGGGGGGGRPGSRKAARKYAETNAQAAMARVAARRGGAARARRVQELLRLVGLEEERHVAFSQQPVGPYEMYVRKLRGAAGSIKQVAAQSNEDDRTVEVQTEEVETADREAQFQLGDDTDFENVLAALRAGEGIERFVKRRGNLSQGNAASLRLSTFIQAASQVCEAVCEKNIEQYKKHFEEGSESKEDQGLFTSASKWKILGQGGRRLSNTSPSARENIGSVLAQRELTGLVFSTLQPNMACSSYMLRSKEYFNEDETDDLKDYGLICVWDTLNPEKPSRLGICRVGVSCCAMGLFQTHLVMAGTTDGQVLLWDLRENKREILAQGDPIQKTANSLCSEGVIRSPTYTSASLGPHIKSHSSKVVDITPIPVEILSKPHQGPSQASFQIATLDDRGVLALWLVTELEKVELGGSSDLGLSINGQTRLVLSRTLSLDPSIEDLNPNKQKSTSGRRTAKTEADASLTPGPCAQSLAFYPKDPNRFIATLSDGSIMQHTRFGNCPPPHHFRAPITFGSFENAPVPVLCLDFSPFLPDYFLAGCMDGSVRLYTIAEQFPILHWVGDCLRGGGSGAGAAGEGKAAAGASSPRSPPRGRGGAGAGAAPLPAPVTSVRWSAHRPGVFYALTRDTEACAFDLLRDQAGPLHWERYEAFVSSEEKMRGDAPRLGLSSDKVKVGRPRLALTGGSTIAFRELGVSMTRPSRDLQFEAEQLVQILSSAL